MFLSRSPCLAQKISQIKKNFFLNTHTHTVLIYPFPTKIVTKFYYFLQITQILPFSMTIAPVETLSPGRLQQSSHWSRFLHCTPRG